MLTELSKGFDILKLFRNNGTVIAGKIDKTLLFAGDGGWPVCDPTKRVTTECATVVPALGLV